MKKVPEGMLQAKCNIMCLIATLGRYLLIPEPAKPEAGRLLGGKQPSPVMHTCLCSFLIKAPMLGLSE